MRSGRCESVGAKALKRVLDEFEERESSRGQKTRERGSKGKGEIASLQGEIASFRVRFVISFVLKFTHSTRTVS